MHTVRKEYKILFLIFVVLGTYYPALFAGYNRVDDFGVFGSLERALHYDFAGTFFSATGAYYRPLTALTFFFDKAVWSLDPSFMHLENILLHTMNTLLVFFIAERIFRVFDTKVHELPLLSALLFAVHPINTEPVNWISGRYDLLASFFVLFAVVLLYKGVDEYRYRYIVYSAFFAFIGSLAKEVAIFFFPAAMFLAYSHPISSAEESNRQAWAVRKKWVTALPFASGILLYFLLRAFVVKGGGSGIGNVVKNVFPNSALVLFDTIRVALKVFGFYIKKLFIPLPLNFAILEISNAYVFGGLFFLLLVFFLLFRRSIFTDLFVVSCLLILSAVAITFSGIPWTPVAERYLYLPSAFFALSIVGVASLLLKYYDKNRWIAAGIVPLLVIAVFVTSRRNIVWQSNLSLYEDTIDKSPNFIKMKNMLAAELAVQKRVEEADAIFVDAIKEKPDHVLLYVNRAIMKFESGKIKEAREIILQAFKHKETAQPVALQMLVRIDEERLFAANSQSDRMNIAAEIIDTLKHLYPMTHDPHGLYRTGQLLLYTGNKQDAAEHFALAYREAPDGAVYKEPAKRLAEKLQRK